MPGNKIKEAEVVNHTICFKVSTFRPDLTMCFMPAQCLVQIQL